MPTDIHEPIRKWEQDQLDRKPYVKEFLRRLADPECPPVFGLYGSWGTGKTSFLNMVIDYYDYVLSNEAESSSNIPKLAIEIIDAWRYEQTGNLATPVMATLKRMAKKGDPLGADKIIQLSRKVLLVTALTATGSILRGLSAGTLSLEDIQKNLEAVEAREPASLRLVDAVDEARGDFKEATDWVCEVLRCEQIVLMIDNLDRCFPDNVVALLESIKNIFSSAEKCVWVLAIDPDVVASYIDQKYKDTEMDGHSYLDKIVQEHFHLPMPRLSGDHGSVATLLSRSLRAGQSPASLLDQDVFLQLPRTLVARRLIKAARVYSQLASPTPYSFGLILLHFCWPAFYRWLSVDNAAHIQNTLHNFYRLKRPSDEGAEQPTPDRFTKDPELVIFLDWLILRRSSDLSKTAEDVRQTILQLREVGLP